MWRPEAFFAGLADRLINCVLWGAGDPPPEVAYLLGWFADLSARRRDGGPLNFADIEAWGRLSGNAPTPWEVSVLTQLDDAVLKKAREDAEWAAQNKRR